MEMKNDHNSSCSFRDEILAYVYDELTAIGRESFEAHLEDCLACIDELAELSEARYSVYEWKNIEFASLETPKIVLPTDQARPASSWLDAITAAFGLNHGWALGAGFAGLLLIGAVGFLIYSNPSEPTLASNSESTETITIAGPAPSVSSMDAVAPAEAEVASDVSDSQPVRASRSSVLRRTMAAPAKAKPVAVRSTTTVAARRAAPNQSIQNSPTLGYYAEDRDESLRLTDIFDDLGTRELD